MFTKEFVATVKAVGTGDGLEDGQFSAVVSVFDNVDSYGDVVMRGAFEEDLKAWEDSGDPIPVIWSHDWADPFSHIGYVVSAREGQKGLEIVGQIDLDNAKGVQVYRLLKGRRVKQFSFAYDILDAAWGEREDQEVFELRKLHIFEVGPCLVGVNQDTELLAVKARQLARGAKAGHELGETTLKTLLDARQHLDDVITRAKGDSASEAPPSPPQTPGTPVPGQTEEPSQADVPRDDDEEPAGAKSSAAPTGAPRRAQAVALITNLS